jgi:hypothetical protein
VSTAPVLHTGTRGLATEMEVVGIVAGEVALGQQMGVLSVKADHGRVETLEDECAVVGRVRVAPFAGGVARQLVEEEVLQLLSDRGPGDGIAEWIVALCRIRLLGPEGGRSCCPKRCRLAARSSCPTRLMARRSDHRRWARCEEQLGGDPRPTKEKKVASPNFPWELARPVIYTLRNSDKEIPPRPRFSGLQHNLPSGIHHPPSSAGHLQSASHTTSAAPVGPIASIMSSVHLPATTTPSNPSFLTSPSSPTQSSTPSCGGTQST